MAVLDRTIDAVLSPAQLLANGFLNALPGIAGAVIVVIVGYFIAYLLGWVVFHLIEKSKLDEWLTSQGLHKSLGQVKVEKVGSLITTWFIFFQFLPQAAALINIGTLSDQLFAFTMWLPRLVFAVLIIFFGLIVVDYFLARVSYFKYKGIDFTKGLIKFVVLFVFVVIALEQLGVQVDIARETFLIIVAGITLGLALAFGIGFGFGMRREAELIMKGVREKVTRKR